MSLLRLLVVFFRIGLMNELQYRANLVMQLFKTGFNITWSLAAVGVVYSHTENLNGWEPAQLVVLLGVFTMMAGLIGVVIQPSMEQLIEDVTEGTLDYILTKPEEAQVLVSVNQVRVWRIIDVAAGLIIISVALHHLGASVGWRPMGEFALTLAAGGAIMYSFWIILATMSFWFVRVGNILMIFHSMYDAAHWPITIYPGWLKAALIFLVPVAFAVTVPSQALVGRLDAELLAGSIALAAALLVGSRVFWKAGLKRYSGASA